MKFFKDLLSKFLIGRICKTIGSLRDYLKDYEYVSDSFYSDAFKTVIKEYLNVDIKKDWIGRLYGIANPNMNDNGKFDITRTIIELDGDNTNNEEYVKYWVHKQLHMIGEVFKIENLYHYINLEFKHVGPIEGDNYLLIFDIVSRKEFAKNLKETLIHASIYAIIGLIVFFTIL